MKTIGRLLPEALYRPEDFMVHEARKAVDAGIGCGDLRQHEPTAHRVAKRLEVIDPRGLISYALATDVEYAHRE